MEHLQLISLGSFCGMKFAIQRLGLGDAHLPFDWIRTTSKGLGHFLWNGFERFFEANRYDLDSGTVHRAEQHSFWHDDVSQPEVREKLQRRVCRFLDLANDFKSQPRDLLFLRSCACTDELNDVEELYSALIQRFVPGSRNRVLLAVVIDGQERREGPIFHASLPGLAFFLQPLNQEGSLDGKAFSWAVGAACDAALQRCSEGFATGPSPRVVQSGADLLEGRYQGGPGRPIDFCDAGLRSGFGDFDCFEPSSLPSRTENHKDERSME
ncbi:unnamed protein product [Effrenium voratum]|nr:unnamed protein product [Effrenium voratum]